jgi:hypothetical protein
MTKKRAYEPTVTISAAQVGGHIILDWFEYRPVASGLMKRVAKQRRVMVRHGEALGPSQLTSLIARMATYVLARSTGNASVPKHLPWMEVGATEWSVPPGGGEGGANRSDDGGLTERPIRS